MEVVNPFILKNKIGMIKFVDELCKLESSAEMANFDGNNNSVSHLEDDIQNPAQYLAAVHTICERYRGHLEQMASSSPSAKKLVAILTILSQHKQYYANLRLSAQQNISTTLV